MEVILKEDIKGVGKKGQIINVKEGYAKNFLFKKNLGVTATPEEIKKLKNAKVKIEKKLEAVKEEAEKISEKLNNKTLKANVKVGKKGKVFGSVTSKEISILIKEELGLEIDKKKIEMSTIKTEGTHIITIKLHPEVKAKLNIIIEGE